MCWESRWGLRLARQAFDHCIPNPSISYGILLVFVLKRSHVVKGDPEFPNVLSLTSRWDYRLKINVFNIEIKLRKL